MRIISLDGRLGGDAEIKKTKEGREFVKFSLANNYYANGKEVTDWFDVNCFDQFVIQNKAKFLTKGRYVIVTGNIRTELSDRNGKLWLNHYVTATNVDTPSFGRQKESSESSTEQPTVSVYTGGTKSDMSVEAKEEVPQYVPQYVPATADFSDSSDLPF